MSVELTSAGSFAVAAAASMAVTPVAIRIAQRTGFLDHPREYRQHAAATPFLGGAAVLAAFLLAGLTIARPSGRLFVALGCAAGLWLLGTLDDRSAVAPKWRLLAEAGAGAALYAVGLGWDTSAGGIADCTLTIVSVVIAVNAFNLMDNLDGACGAVTAAASAGVGVLAAIKGEVAVAGLAFALCGACAGFLSWNLTGPARIFLGDGGSMLAGFLVAALAIATARHDADGNGGVLVGALLAGLPIFDAALVTFSRTRRGISIVTGGRDHLTHRLLLVLRTPRQVAAFLAAVQGVLCALAIVAYKVNAVTPAAVGLGVFLTGIVAIVLLDTPRWRTGGIAIGGPELNVAPAPGIEEA